VNGTAQVRSATVRREAGRWFVSFTVKVERPVRSPARPNAVIGVDLGITTLAVLSTGAKIENPKHYDTAHRKLARLSRAVSRKQGPDRRNGQLPSRRWSTANLARNQVHHRVVNLRRDGIHKLTTTLAREYGTIVVEDLNVAGMVKNRKLARRISDAGFGEIRRQLAYKTQWNGSQLHVADRWYPSSKTCSACQTVKATLSLATRTYACDHCGLRIDRDVNAAINLAALVKQHVAGSGPETQNGRRADQKTEPSSAGGVETSTLHRT
jgi:putative transposase